MFVYVEALAVDDAEFTLCCIWAGLVATRSKLEESVNICNVNCAAATQFGFAGGADGSGEIDVGNVILRYCCTNSRDETVTFGKE